MRPLMVQGTSSWAGKSLLCTALARLIARRGIRVAPFKAQNMSNNARVVDGGEIGTAQWLQALAAEVEPDVRMNPVLVKPEADARSQVVLMGRPDLVLSREPWRARPPRLWPVIAGAHASLSAEYEMLVIEGAGSPAEINLRATDLANMRTAALAGARVLLVADIERGGALAHLYGTWSLLEADDRARLCGFVLNKFRGDRALLTPGPEMVTERTGVPVRAVIPRIEHGLPDEDGAAEPARRGCPMVAVVRYPAASNLDELKPLEQVADVVWARTRDALDGAALIVLPGSKSVASDLGWLRASGVADAIAAHDVPVLGVCGGLMMLGGAISDPHGVEGGSTVGLGHLPITTRLEAEKLTRRTTLRFPELAPPWSGLSGLAYAGYEIRHGRTPAPVAAAGRFLGVAVHGLFESPDVVRALLGAAPATRLDAAIDHLADVVGSHLDIDALLEEAA